MSVFRGDRVCAWGVCFFIGRHQAFRHHFPVLGVPYAPPLISRAPLLSMAASKVVDSIMAFGAAVCWPCSCDFLTSRHRQHLLLPSFIHSFVRSHVHTYSWAEQKMHFASAVLAKLFPQVELSHAELNCPWLITRYVFSTHHELVGLLELFSALILPTHPTI